MIDKEQNNNSQPDNGPRVNGGPVAVDQPVPISDTQVSGNLALAPQPEQHLSLEQGELKTVAKSNSAAANDQKPEQMSKGEEKFNDYVYKKLGYWTNLISSVAIADYFLNPESKGRAALNKYISKSTQALTKMGVSLKNAHHQSKIGLETLTLLSGGTLLLIPMKIMEDNKRKIVHKLNKDMGVDQTAADGHEKTPDEIHIEQEQPKQSWGNVIWRRVVGTLAVVGSGLALDHLWRDKKTLVPDETHDLGFAKVHYDAKVLGGKERVTNQVFGMLDNAAEAINGKKFKPNGIVSRWSKLLILDSVFTVITAVVMKMTNGAKKGKMPKEIDNTKDPAIVSNTLDNITTADEVPKSQKNFSDKIEKRVNCLIDAKHKDDMPHSFVDNIKTNEAAIGVGV